MYITKDIEAKDIKREATRVGFGRGLAEAARQNDKIVGRCADLTGSTKMNFFADEFPERFVQVGIAEQNLVTVASGMAAMGKIPFAASYAAFNPGRNWEQIRTTICLNDRNVKLVGAHAGLYTGPDGATHQMLEDIALMRSLPNMVVLVPGDAIEAEKATLAIAEDSRPAYIRLAREATPVFTSERTPFNLNRAYVLTPGRDVTIVSTGTMTYPSLVAAEKLYKDGIDVEVVHMPVIKPFDGVTVLKSVAKTGAVITVEEAQINGGLGGAVAEFLGENHPTPLKRMGVRDRFGQSGNPEKLFEVYGLTVKDIMLMAHRLMSELDRDA